MKFKSTRKKCSSFCASRPRDATRRMNATELVAGLRSSVAAALQPSTQLVASLLEVLPVALRRGTRRHLEGGRALRAASAPSQQHQLRRSSSKATAVSRDHWASPRMDSPSNCVSPPPDIQTVLYSCHAQTNTLLSSWMPLYAFP